jgi:hypothetical protein
MSEPKLVDPHDPVMTGENSFVRLSNDGGNTIPERVSHWRVLWSPAGQGHALFMESSLSKKSVVYSDNAGLVRFLQRTIEALLHKPFADESLPIVDARFSRTGNSLSTVGSASSPQGRDHPQLVGPDAAVRPHHAAGRHEPPLGRLQHLHPRSRRPAFGERRSRHGQGVQERSGRPLRAAAWLVGENQG